MNNTTKLVAAITVAFAAATASAAEDKIVLAALGDVTGKVLVNKGQGFVSARQGMEVRSGDRVLALGDSAAKVVYKTGCVTDLKENQVLAIGSSGCETQPMNSRSDPVKLAQASTQGSIMLTPMVAGQALGAPATVAGANTTIGTMMFLGGTSLMVVSDAAISDQ